MTDAQNSQQRQFLQVIIKNPRVRLGSGFLTGWCTFSNDQLEIVAIVTSNGVKQFRPRCMNCGRIVLHNFPHNLLTPAERAEARVVKAANAALCDRCGAVGGVEVHHWAPQALFYDAELWPKGNLCQRCHKRWHNVMWGAR